MGNLLALLKSKAAADVFIDLENSNPSEKELPIFNRVREVLEKGQHVRAALDEYKGAQDAVRTAMQTPTDATEEAALLALIGCVDTIAAMYELSKDLEGVVGPLLETLCVPNEEHKSTLEDQQALAMQLARLFDFVLSFDALRMMRPVISNDFSFYKRLLGKYGKHPAVKVNEEEASQMAMFTAMHIPLTTSLSRAAGKVYQQNPYVTDALAVMANSCKEMIKSKRYDNPATLLLCARAMTGAIVLFDHVDELGVFRKSSPVLTKKCIDLLKKEFPEEQALLNAIQFSTLHFNDATTPESIKDLFQ